MHSVVSSTRTYWMQQGQVSHDPSSKKTARQETAFLYDAFASRWGIRKINIKSYKIMAKRCYCMLLLCCALTWATRSQVMNFLCFLLFSRVWSQPSHPRRTADGLQFRECDNQVQQEDTPFSWWVRSGITGWYQDDKPDKLYRSELTTNHPSTIPKHPVTTKLIGEADTSSVQDVFLSSCKSESNALDHTFKIRLWAIRLAVCW